MKICQHMEEYIEAGGKYHRWGQKWIINLSAKALFAHL
jgi:hypothetical protein